MKTIQRLSVITDHLKVLKDGNLGRDILAIYLYQGFILIIGLVTSILIARTLGPRDKGVIDLFTLLVGCITEFGLFGINSGLLYYLANKKESLSKIHGSAIAFSLIAGIAILVFGIMFAPILQTLLNGLPFEFLLAGFILSPFLLYNNLWGNIMIGKNLAPAVSKIQFALGFLNIMLLSALWFLHALNVMTIFYCMIFSFCITTLIYLITLSRINNYEFIPSKDMIINSLKYGMKIYPGFIINWLHFRIDVILINIYFGTLYVGLYSTSINWAEQLWFIGYGVINAGLYKIASESRETSYKLTKNLFFIVIFITGTTGIILAVMSKYIIHFLYGDAFGLSVLPLILIIPGIIAWDAGRVLSQYVSYNRGLPHICTYAAVGGLIINILGNIYVIPRFGINGAAVMSSISYSLVLLALGIVFIRLKPGNGEICDAANCKNDLNPN